MAPSPMSFCREARAMAWVGSSLSRCTQPRFSAALELQLHQQNDQWGLAHLAEDSFQEKTPCHLQDMVLWPSHTALHFS